VTAADPREEIDLVQEAAELLVREGLAEDRPGYGHATGEQVAQSLANAGLLQVAADSSKAGSNDDADLAERLTRGAHDLAVQTGLSYAEAHEQMLRTAELIAAARELPYVRDQRDRLTEALEATTAERDQLRAKVERVREVAADLATMRAKNDDVRAGAVIAAVRKALDGDR
jgi:hypothetical protein